MEKMRKFSVVMIFDEQNRVLFGKRKDNQLYTTVAGGVEENETPFMAGIREAKEEVDISIKPTELIYINEKIVTAKDTGKKIKIFLYKTKVNSKRVNLSNKNDPDDEIINNSLKFYKIPLRASILENLHVDRKDNVVVDYLNKNFDLDSVSVDSNTFKNRLEELKDKKSDNTKEEIVKLFAGTNDVPSKTIKKYGEEFDNPYDNNFFGGIFASIDENTAGGHGKNIQIFKIPKDKILDINDSFGEDAEENIKKIIEDNSGIIPTDEEASELLEYAEEKYFLSNDEPDMGMERVQDLLMVSEDYEADWKMQGLRGELARRDGYHAVQMNDEYGISYLVLKAVNGIHHKEYLNLDSIYTKDELMKEELKPKEKADALGYEVDKSPCENCGGTIYKDGKEVYSADTCDDMKDFIIKKYDEEFSEMDSVSGLSFSSRLKQLAKLIKAPHIIDTKIEDIGEVILGARKHVMAYMAKLNASKSTTIPIIKPEQLEKMGFNKENIYALLLVRSFHKNARRSQKSMLLKEFKEHLESGNISSAKIQAKVINYVGIVNPLRLLVEATMKQVKELSEIWMTSDNYLAHGKRYVIINGKRTKSFDDFLADSAKKEDIEKSQPKAKKKKAKLELRWYTTPRKDGLYHLGVKISASKFLVLKKFETMEDMREYIGRGDDVQDELRAELEELKKTPITRSLENKPRVGDDYRKGGDISPDEFHKEFPFRGIQFGNWLNNEERQISINRTFDALKDLGSIMDMDSVELTHNERLSIAFGARGRGGKNAPMAHYEPTQQIINLTKKNGAGAFSHEFYHSFDMLLADTVREHLGNRDATKGYFSESASALKIGTYFLGYEQKQVGKELTELAQLQVDILDKLRKMDFYEASVKLDGATKRDYWSSTVEIVARTFEVYTKQSLASENKSNDFLANILDSTDVYPNKDDMKIVSPMIKEFINKANKWRRENEK